MSVRILTGDCRDVLKTLPDESVHCVVTSPPYWGLRDYGTGKSGIGLEDTLAEHLVGIRETFAEVRRVLRSDGTLWLNYGDAYNNFRSQMGPGQMQRDAILIELSPEYAAMAERRIKGDAPMFADVSASASLERVGKE